VPKLFASKTIRTVADLAALTDEDLQRCLSALRAAIRERRNVHSDMLAQGRLPASTPLRFDEFVWKPSERPRADRTLQVQRTTPIVDLPIRRRAVHRLVELHVLALEDLSAISERELLAVPDLGRTTIARLREYLGTVGLDFGEHPDPQTAEYVRNQMLRRLPTEQRTSVRHGLPDEAPITRLGLRGPTMERAKRRNWHTVGDLRLASLRALSVGFGRQELREVVHALNETGAGLRSNPSRLELWHVGVVDLVDLERPRGDETSVMELRPWLGAVVESLHRAGVQTLGELRNVAATRSLSSVRGVGKHSEGQLLEFLGLRPIAAAIANPVPTARSVFDRGTS